MTWYFHIKDKRNKLALKQTIINLQDCDWKELKSKYFEKNKIVVAFVTSYVVILVIKFYISNWNT